MDRAIKNLQSAVDIIDPSDVEQAGIIQFFEIAFELSWKTMKDYLQHAGYDTKTPRDTIKQAYQTGIIEEGHDWLEMLEKRNELSHTYDEESAASAVKSIKVRYVDNLVQVYTWLKSK